MVDRIKVYERTLKKNQDTYHSQCIFRNNSLIENMQLFFNENGSLTGEFVCSRYHQGYEGSVLGGIIAAIIDASMAQCCMGHGIIAYTADLSIRYKKPVRINTPTILLTEIAKIIRGKLFSLKCCIKQKGKVHVEATGSFFKVNKK
jgi:hypothetical protein